jgi:preprotein translocase subunit SecA
MLDRVKHDTITILAKIQIRRPEDVVAVEPPPVEPKSLQFQHAAAPSLTAAAPPPAAASGPRGVFSPQRPVEPPEPVAPYVREQPKVGRNQPCPCGSGKKFKQCHGRLD